MRPLLLPVLPRLWRDATTLQLGVDPERAVVLTPVDRVGLAFLASLDGGRRLDDVVAGAPPGWDRSAVRALVTELASSGAVIDAETLAPAGRRAGRRGLPVDRPVSPDLAALLLTHGEAATVRMAARRSQVVLVKSRGRIGPVIGALLAATGVGRVTVIGDGVVEPGDEAVGGLTPADVGRPYAVAAADAVRRAAPGVDTRPPPDGRPDFVVLAAGPIPPPVDRVRWTQRGVPHLPVLFRDATAVIGPLVVPGRGPCLDCVEEHRRDRDPVWPALAAQLATDPRPQPSDSVVVTAAAAVTALQVSCHLDGGHAETVGNSLEIRAPGQPIRYRPWAPHPRCGCTDAPPPDVPLPEGFPTRDA